MKQLSLLIPVVRWFLTRLLIPLAALIVTDLHWAVMQTITWAEMISQRQPAISFSEMLAETVSGEAPCDRCEAIAAERSSEDEHLLDLLAKAPLVAENPARLPRLGHPSTELFDLSPRQQGLPEVFHLLPTPPPDCSARA
ncbi:MAG: hypothetical protein AAF236_04730 [Verrucomicrobiota bacterium]